MTARTTYVPADVNPFARLALFDRAMGAVDQIAAEEAR